MQFFSLVLVSSILELTYTLSPVLTKLLPITSSYPFCKKTSLAVNVKGCLY